MKCEKCNFKNATGARFCAQCGGELNFYDTPTEFIRSAIRSIERGTCLFGRYEVVEEIGSGGMGTVYRVYDRTINEMVALKIIKPEIATDSAIIERFSQELKTARKISHRNICRVFDIDEEKGVHYISMEYIEGDDLRRLISRIGPLNVAKTIDIAKQICEGLAEAHAWGVIHRDLKPQNIMIDKDGMAKIMDFGIARQIRTKGITMTGTIIGTPEYMSPEQTEGKGVDQRSDIYSLGVVLFEALTGRVPFAGDTPLSVAVKQKTQSPPNPREFNAQIPGDLGILVLKCLNKEKDKRYQNVTEIMSHLNLISQGLSVNRRARGEKESMIAGEFPGNKRIRRSIFITGTVLAVGVLAVGAWYFGKNPSDPGSVAREPATIFNEGESEKKIPESGKADEDKLNVTINKNKTSAIVEAQGITQNNLSTKADPKIQKTPQVPLTREPGNSRSRVEEDIRKGLIEAGKAFENGQYRESLNYSHLVLQLDPNNVKAAMYAEQTEEKLSEAEIRLLVDQYMEALESNPIEFLKTHLAPDVYDEIGKEVESFFPLYEKRKASVTGGVNVNIENKNKGQVNFYQQLLGTRKGTSVEQEIWSGTMKWNMEKQKSGWQITGIIFEPGN